MTVKELKEELKKYNNEAYLKIKVSTFSDSKCEIVDETEEEVQKVIYEHSVDEADFDYVYLQIIIYKD